MEHMPDKTPSFWAHALLWIYSHNNELTYAIVAGVVAILRSCWAKKDNWPRRLLDASICSIFAFNLQPTVEIFAVVLRDKYPVLNDVITEKTIISLAVFLGFLGTDFVSGFLNKKLGGKNDTE